MELKIDLPKLVPDEAAIMDAPITEEEIQKASKIMKSGKAQVRWFNS